MRKSSGVSIIKQLADIETIKNFEKIEKINIGLSKAAIEYFKKEAKEAKIPYQKLIRRALDSFVPR